VWEAVRWWIDWKKYNSLPHAGGIGDQPAYVYEAIHICEGEASIVQQSEQEKNRQRALEKQKEAQNSQERR